MIYTFDNKDLEVSKLKRHLTSLKKKNGLESSFNQYKDFLDSTKLFYKDAISLYDRYVEYANLLKKEPQETIGILMKWLEGYDPNDLGKNLIPIANLYANVHREYGFKFLAANIKEAERLDDKIEMLFLASDWYCEQKKFDEAFKILRQANDFCYLADLYDALKFKAKVSSKMATIAEQENKPDAYFTYSLYMIIEEAATELTRMPNIYPYFRRIDEFKTKTYYLFEDEIFLNLCNNKFGGVDKFQRIVLEILTDKLFGAFKIDNSYCNEERLKNEEIAIKIKLENHIDSLKTLEVLSGITVILNEIN